MDKRVLDLDERCVVLPYLTFVSTQLRLVLKHTLSNFLIFKKKTECKWSGIAVI